MLGFIFLFVSKNLVKSGQPNEHTHVRCSKCFEFVLPKATKCKHCCSDLIPFKDFEQYRYIIENPIESAFTSWVSKNPTSARFFSGAVLVLILLAFFMLF